MDEESKRFAQFAVLALVAVVVFYAVLLAAGVYVTEKILDLWK